tara:strand:+ start:233 stop:703 length:471 start_codon:yes stop_codon:yes gene_type:complete
MANYDEQFPSGINMGEGFRDQGGYGAGYYPPKAPHYGAPMDPYPTNPADRAYWEARQSAALEDYDNRRRWMLEDAGVLPADGSPPMPMPKGAPVEYAHSTIDGLLGEAMMANPQQMMDYVDNTERLSNMRGMHTNEMPSQTGGFGDWFREKWGRNK